MIGALSSKFAFLSRKKPKESHLWLVTRNLASWNASSDLLRAETTPISRLSRRQAIPVANTNISRRFYRACSKGKLFSCRARPHSSISITDIKLERIPSAQPFDEVATSDTLHGPCRSELRIDQRASTKRENIERESNVVRRIAAI